MPTPTSKALAEVQAKTTAVNDTIFKLKRSCDDEQRTLESVTGQYDAACRDIARGKSEIAPSSYKAEMERRSQMIQGLRSLILDAEAEHAPLARQEQILALKVQREQEAEELADLISVQAEKAKNLEAAHVALRLAEIEERQVTNKIGQLRIQAERNEQRRKNGYL